MKKIFTLAAVVLASLSLMAADQVLFSWTPKEGLSNADITAGTYALPGEWLTSVTGGAAEMIVPSNGNMRIRGSQLAFNSSNSYFHITLNEAFQAGDQININSSSNTNNLWFATEATRPANEKAASAVIVQGTAYTIGLGNALIGQKEFYIWRAGSTTQVGEISIVRPEPSTDPVINAMDASIKTLESDVEVTENVAVSGANLTGTTLTATLNPEVAGLSVTLENNAIEGGIIATNAVLHYTQTVNISGATTLVLSDGTTTKEIAVSYLSRVVASAPKAISVSTTWDFSELSGALQFTTEEEKNIEYAYTDLFEITCPETFNAEALSFKGEYPFRDNSHKYAQNGTLHFVTTVPGSIVVKFSDTGTSASATSVKRYLIVNNETTEYWTSRENNGTEAPYEAQLNVTTGEIKVPAGDVTITGSNAITISLLTFTAQEATAIENTEVGAKAVKVVRDGQVLIIRDGKMFNALGAEVK